MSGIKITESTIRAAATPESFQRGKSYFEQGAIYNTAIQGNGVSGDCEGTQSPRGAYHVRVELDEVGIRFAHVHTPQEFATRVPC